MHDIYIYIYIYMKAKCQAMANEKETGIALALRPQEAKCERDKKNALCDHVCRGRPFR